MDQAPQIGHNGSAMNRRYTASCLIFATAIIVPLLFSSCNGSSRGTTAHAGIVIIPKPAEGMVFGSSISAAEAKSRPPAEIPPVKAPLTPDILVQQVVNTNLDLDDMDEQIVVFKKRDIARNSFSNGSATAPAVRSGDSAGNVPAPGKSDGVSATGTAQSNGATGSGAAVTPGGNAGGSSAPTAPRDGIGGSPPGNGGIPNTAGRVAGAETVQDLEAMTANDAIWIMVVDFDTVRNTYVVAWEAPTLATNIRTFKVFTTDLLGDHNLEIVCEGTNAKGEQTINAFKRTSSSGVGLHFQSILSLASDGSIDIQEQQRSDAYHSAQALGKSFPIVTLTRDTGSANPLDMLRTTYFYRSQDGGYVKGFTEKVPGNRIEEAQLSKLYNGSAANFEEALDGPWYRINNGAPSSTGQPTAESTDIMFFDRRARTITFSHGEVEQAFTIEESYKTAFQRGIQLKVRNDAIPTLRHFAAVSVLALDTIEVAMQGDQSWDGTYKRLTGGLQQALFGNAKDGVTLSDLKLSGLYKDDAGAELFFSPPRFTLREHGSEKTGEFIIYQYKQKVLELRTITEAGRVGDRKLYMMDYSEEKNRTQIVRVLKLTPATVTVHGFEPLNNNVQRFEQIEVIGQPGAGGAKPAPAS
jgi:hypothetical protein